jgi:hypothetical protein
LSSAALQLKKLNYTQKSTEFKHWTTANTHTILCSLQFISFNQPFWSLLLLQIKHLLIFLFLRIAQPFCQSLRLFEIAEWFWPCTFTSWYHKSPNTMPGFSGSVPTSTLVRASPPSNHAPLTLPPVYFVHRDAAVTKIWLYFYYHCTSPVLPVVTGQRLQLTVHWATPEPKFWALHEQLYSSAFHHSSAECTCRSFLKGVTDLKNAIIFCSSLSS